MFLYDSAMDGKFEGLCNRISFNLAPVIAYHHPGDVKAIAMWMGLVNICAPRLTATFRGDCYAFSRYMCGCGFLRAGTFSAHEDFSWDASKAYAEIFRTLPELMHLVVHSCPSNPFAWHEYMHLLDIVVGMEAHLRVMAHETAKRRREEQILVEQKKLVDSVLEDLIADHEEDDDDEAVALALVMDKFGCK